jgi:radical SAM protein with 4Fe4S-binding SPASM domain
MLNEKTKENLRRKANYIDDVQLIDEVPMFSWIDINVTELCNRKCVFCPRIDEAEYPNQNLNMSIDLARKIADELRSLDYQGVVVFSGFGEPMSCPHFVQIVQEFKGVCRIELVTNGDYLRERQINDFHGKFSNAGLDISSYILRDRWHHKEDDYGLKLTNRAGTINIGEQAPVDVTHPCYYTAYSLTIDWNGDILLCMQDWNKKVKFGNVTIQSLKSIWLSKYYDQFRQDLINGKRTRSPCYKCNTDGMLHGHNHAKLWKK